jgi:hypothetical protein
VPEALADALGVVFSEVPGNGADILHVYLVVAVSARVSVDVESPNVKLF